MAITVKVEGIDQIVKELQRRNMDVSLGLEAICHAGAEVIQREAEDRAPGSIRSGIERKTTLRQATRVRVAVRPDKEHFYAKFVEYGTGPHRIPKARRRGRRKPLLIGGRFVAWANHPGARARPFMRPAFDYGKGPAQDAMRRQTARKLRI
jgi:HK97 gp10 family phage protein